MAAIAVAGVLSYFVLPPVYESEVRLFVPPTAGQVGLRPEQYRALALSEPVLDPVRQAVAPGEPFGEFVKRFTVRFEAASESPAVTVSGRTPWESQSLASLWLESFTNTLRQFVARRIEGRLAELQAAEERMQDGLRELGERLRGAGAEGELILELAAAAAYGQQYGEVLRQAEGLRLLQRRLETAARPEVLLSPQQPEAPSSPRTLLNMTVAGAAGAMVGALLALAAEWWQNPPAPGPARGPAAER